MNNRYGEFVVTPAIMMGMENVIIDRILFGHSQELHPVDRDNQPASSFRRSFGWLHRVRKVQNKSRRSRGQHLMFANLQL